METTNKKPVFETRLDSIRLSIWKNHRPEGADFFTVNVYRRYKAGENEWSNSNHYTGLSQLALLKQAVNVAEQYLISQEMK